MRWRAARIVALAAAALLACGSQGTTQENLEGGDDLDAGEPREGGGPNPDAIDLGEGGADDSSAGKTCDGLPDGTPCGPAPDDCHDLPVCSQGACAEPAAKADGFVCAAAKDACHTDGTCKSGKCEAPPARADGYQWDSSDTYARCCGGKAIHTTTDTDCGVCGIQCNKSNGESCGLFNNHYYCLGCQQTSQCWSHCCSQSFGTPYRCAASDCTSGACDSTYCPAGTHCVSGGGTTSNYCAY